MAKKQPGSNVGMIVSLIFFVLGTFICGFLAYSAYSEQDKYINEAKKAKTDLSAKENENEENEVRKLLLRIATGTEDPEDRKNFELLAKQKPQAVREEFNRLQSKIRGLVPGGEADFTWALDGDKPAVTPNNTLPGLVGKYSNEAKQARTAKETADKLRAKAEEDLKNIQKERDNDRADFKRNLDDLTAQMVKNRQDDDKRYQEFVKSLTAEGAKSANLQQILRDEQDKAAKTQQTMTEQIDTLKTKVSKYEGGSDKGIDPLSLETARGKIESREGSFVFINLGKTAKVLPGQTFFVLGSEQKPKDALVDNGRGAVEITDESLAAIAKGKIEVIEVISDRLSRCKIIDQPYEVRNPIGKGDGIFNLAFGERLKIAFCGIIDINGDGFDDTPEFVRILEKQGIRIDSYLDLNDRAVKGKGITAETDFLVKGPSPSFAKDVASGTVLEKDPRIAAKQEIAQKMDEMEAKAKEKKVQVVPYRKFLTSIGVKIAPQAATADYGIYLKREDSEKDSLMKKEDDGR